MNKFHYIYIYKTCIIYIFKCILKHLFIRFIIFSISRHIFHDLQNIWLFPYTVTINFENSVFKSYQEYFNINKLVNFCSLFLGQEGQDGLRFLFFKTEFMKSPVLSWRTNQFLWFLSVYYINHEILLTSQLKIHT